MKSLFALAFLLCSAAHAAPQNVSLTCDAHELAPGNVARNGQVSLQLSTEGKVVNSSWTINVTWKGVDEPIVQPGSVCGAEIKDACVATSRGWSFGVFSLSQACGIGPVDTRGELHHATDVNIVLATGPAGMSHGRFSCAAHDVGNYAQIELYNCK